MAEPKISTTRDALGDREPLFVSYIAPIVTIIHGPRRCRVELPSSVTDRLQHSPALGDKLLRFINERLDLDQILDQEPQEAKIYFLASILPWVQENHSKYEALKLQNEIRSMANAYLEAISTEPIREISNESNDDVALHLKALATYPRSGGNLSKNNESYRERTDRSRNAVEWLADHYPHDGNNFLGLTLADIKFADPSLYEGLRNYAKKRKIDLEDILPKGADRRGRPRKPLPIDPGSLDASDPVQALALKAVRKIAYDREYDRNRKRSKKLEP